MSKLRFTIAFSVLCVAAIAAFIFGSAYAMATVPGTYLPLVTTDPGPITVVHVPVPYISLDMREDGAGQDWLAVQAVSPKDDHPKMCVVYRVVGDQVVETVTHVEIYGACRFFVDGSGAGYVYGPGREQEQVYRFAVDGWQP